jgi:hypothetical protein
MTDESPEVQVFGAALLLQAVPAIAGAIVVTFSPDHSPLIGLLVFAGVAFFMAGGQMLAAFSLSAWPRARATLAVQALSSIVSGGLAAAFLGGERTTFTLCVSIWAGALALTYGFAAWFVTDRALARDLSVLTGLSGLLAIIEAAIPLSDVYAVGIFGAYLAIVAVFTVIAGLSLRFAPRPVDLQKEKI